jgi:hypothetical protein
VAVKAWIFERLFAAFLCGNLDDERQLYLCNYIRMIGTWWSWQRDLEIIRRSFIIWDYFCV